jgi:hypothetical protein
MARPAFAGKRRDANEADIVDALEAIGCTVERMDTPVDLLVGYRALNFLLEVKDGDKPPSRRRRTDVQRDFFKRWAGQVRIVKTPEEAIQVVTEAYRG